jgi:subtilisin family serine protease
MPFSNTANCFHGNFVSGIIGSKGQNIDMKGTLGNNHNIKVVPIRLAKSLNNYITEWSVIRAYRYAMINRFLYDETNGQIGAFIVATNSSFGIPYGDPADFPDWEEMYDFMGYAGILSIVATDNEDYDFDVVTDVPTNFQSEYLVRVTSTNRYDKKSSRAGFGANTIDIGAPGESVYSTINQNNMVDLDSGTSFATALTSGVVSLMYSAVSENVIQSYSVCTLALMFKEILLESADNLTELLPYVIEGRRLNAFNAIQSIYDLNVSHRPPPDSTRSSQSMIASATAHNYPNPFNPETTIAFTISSDSKVSINIYNIRGQRVRNLINDNYQTGNHRVVWGGTNDHGHTLSSGYYFYRITTDEYIITRRMLLLK